MSDPASEMSARQKAQQALLLEKQKRLKEFYRLFDTPLREGYCAPQPVRLPLKGAENATNEPSARAGIAELTKVLGQVFAKYGLHEWFDKEEKQATLFLSR